MKFLTREMERVEIGQRAGAALIARVERRTLDLRRNTSERGFSLRVEWLRPIAIEAGPGTSSQELSLRVSPDPWARALVGILVLAVGSVVLTTLASALRSRWHRKR